MTQATALGFDPLTRRWVTGADSSAVVLAPLRGELTTTDRALTEASGDLGRITYRRPAAVLRPGDADDIARMITLCRDHQIPVAAQGAGHTTHGQSLVEGGLAIDMSALQNIHEVQETWADVGAGVLWSDLAPLLAGRGVQFAGGLTGYMGLTVGGTLSVGGISNRYRQGAQIDEVRALQMVTGRGEILWCSETEHADLFAAALGGLGQVGIITRVKLNLTPAPTWVHTWALPYTDADDAFAAMRIIMERNQVHEVWCMVLPPSPDAPPTFQVHLAYHESDSGVPDEDDILRNVPDWAGLASTGTVRFLDHITTYDTIIDLWRKGNWDERLKPWFDVWLSDAAVAGFVTEVVSEMTLEDWSLPHGGGFVLLFPHRAQEFRRPRLRLPRQKTGFVWLFDVLNVAMPYPDPADNERMLARNHRWMDRAGTVRGVRYPIGSLRYTPDDWRQHYGSTYPDVVWCKDRYDPAAILNAGPGIWATQAAAGPGQQIEE